MRTRRKYRMHKRSGRKSEGSERKGVLGKEKRRGRQ